MTVAVCFLTAGTTRAAALDMLDGGVENDSPIEVYVKLKLWS